MYCLLEIKTPLMRQPHWIEKDEYSKMRQIIKQSHELRDSIELYTYFVDAYEDLKDWCINSDTSPEYIITSRHTAERKCRGVLLELKTYFLQTETKLKRKYGENSAIYNLFISTKNDAKQMDDIFSFVMDLKECANHCHEIVHSFISPVPQKYIQPCCVPSQLLSSYNNWTKKNMNYLRSLTCNIDLLTVFQSVYIVLKIIQKKLISHLLTKDNIKDGLLELRAFMDSHFLRENCTSFHLAHMVYMNGKDAPKISFYQNRLNVKFEAYPIDWNVIYELTDLLQEWQE